MSRTNGFSEASWTEQNGHTGWKLLVPWGRGIRLQYLKNKIFRVAHLKEIPVNFLN